MMQEPGRKFGALPVVIAAVVVVGVATLVIFLSTNKRDDQGLPRGKGQIPLAYLTNIIRATSAPAATVAIGTNATGVKLPTILELLNLMKEWRENNPVYHMLVETTGPDVSSTTDVFTYKRQDGLPVTHLQNQIYQPVSLSFILQLETNRADAFFPQANQVVSMANSTDKTNALRQLGWVESAAGFDPLNMFKSARASFVESGPGFYALTFVFPGDAFKMPAGAGDLFLTIKVDPQGKTLAVEQLTLGARLISKMTYFADDLGKVLQSAPRIPQTAPRSSKTFQEVLEEEANLTKKKLTRTI